MKMKKREKQLLENNLRDSGLSEDLIKEAVENWKRGK